MIRIYGLKNCDMCRKATATLRARGGDVRFIDVRTETLGRNLLEHFLATLGPALVNTRSTTWRALSAAERLRPALELLEENPSLMKRPVIERDGTLTLGWSKAVQAHYGA